VFDDRIIHGVQTIQGTMDPLQGRVVLHGHLRADSAAMIGPLEPAATVPVIGPILERIKILAGQHTSVLNGFVTLRLFIQPDGRVTKVQALCDRILPLSADGSCVESFKRDVVGLLSDLQFPPASAASELTLPVLISA
jgi:hypothetical protein